MYNNTCKKACKNRIESKISKLSNSEKKIQKEHRKRHFYQNLSHQAFLQKFQKGFFFTPEFALEISKFQNSEYEVHKPTQIKFLTYSVK
jgi:hypothetical protein